MEQYYKKLGGRPQKPAPKTGPGRKRKSMGTPKASPATDQASEHKKRRRSTKADSAVSETPAESGDEETNWVPKGKNWDKDVSSIDTIVRDPDSGGLYAFLLWNNGRRSRVSIDSCYEKCPMKVSVIILEGIRQKTNNTNINIY